jgi:hypothetical protein
MPLIEKEFVPPKKEQCKVRLDPDVMDLLESYCRFMESSQNYVLERLLRYGFNRDRDFQVWLQKNRTTAGEDEDRAHAADTNERWPRLDGLQQAET